MILTTLGRFTNIRLNHQKLSPRSRMTPPIPWETRASSLLGCALKGFHLELGHVLCHAAAPVSDTCLPHQLGYVLCLCIHTYVYMYIYIYIKKNGFWLWKAECFAKPSFHGIHKLNAKKRRTYICHYIIHHQIQSYCIHNIHPFYPILSPPNGGRTSTPAAVHRRGFQCPVAGVLDDADAAHQLCLVAWLISTIVGGGSIVKMAEKKPLEIHEKFGGFLTPSFFFDWTDWIVFFEEEIHHGLAGRIIGKICMKKLACLITGSEQKLRLDWFSSCSIYICDAVFKELAGHLLDDLAVCRNSGLVLPSLCRSADLDLRNHQRIRNIWGVPYMGVPPNGWFIEKSH